MKIVIAGAGEIGFELGKVLSEENHDVTILDQDMDCLKRVAEHLDVLTVEGNATSPKCLIRANVASADLMVAVTSVDEVNIIASTMAKRLGVERVIARVRNDELSEADSPIQPSELGIDVLIHPELSAASEIHQLIKRASASDVVSLAHDRMQLVGLRVEKNSPVADLTLAGFARQYPEIPFRVIAISRRGRTIIPRGDNRIQTLDHLFLLAGSDHIRRLIEITGHTDIKLNRIMIAGGNEIGRMLARKLIADTQSWEIKLIEPDEGKAAEMAYEFRDILVLHGDPTDTNLLVVEGIQEMDAFISVTDDEESNLISSLMAKHLNVRKTVSLVSKPQYIPLSQTIGLDTIINVKAAATDEIHRQIRQGHLLTVKALQGIKAEILEIEAGPKCRLLDRPVRDLSIPDGIVIGGVYSRDRMEIATGNTIIRKGDQVILFALPKAIPAIETLF